MDKITYLAELAEGLARWVPQRERRDILRYYAEYFEEAGPDREAEVIQELGDPWALSSRLAVEGGYVTQEQAMSWTPRKRWPKVLIGAVVGLSIFALVSGIGLLAFNAMRFVGSVRGVAIATEATEAIPLPSEAIPFDRVIEDATIIDGDVAMVEGTGYTAFRYTDGGELTPFDSIDADIDLGNIQIVAGDDYTLYIEQSDTLIGYEPAWEVRDGTFRLKDSGRSWQANSWNDLKKLFGMGQWAVEVTITVPEGAVLDKVSVKTGLGNVMLYGIDAERVTAETGMGNVECYNARNVKRLELESGMGNVELGMEVIGSSADIALKTGMGNVEANLVGCSEEECAYDLGSGMGSVTVNGAVLIRSGQVERQDNLPYRLTAESGMGDVNVYFHG